MRDDISDEPVADDDGNVAGAHAGCADADDAALTAGGGGASVEGGHDLEGGCGLDCAVEEPEPFGAHARDAAGGVEEEGLGDVRPGVPCLDQCVAELGAEPELELLRDVGDAEDIGIHGVLFDLERCGWCFGADADAVLGIDVDASGSDGVAGAGCFGDLLARGDDLHVGCVGGELDGDLEPALGFERVGGGEFGGEEPGVDRDALGNGVEGEAAGLGVEDFEAEVVCAVGGLGVFLEFALVGEGGLGVCGAGEERGDDECDEYAHVDPL